LALLAVLAAPAIGRCQASGEYSQPEVESELVSLEPELRALDELDSYFHDPEVAEAQYLNQPALDVPAEMPSAESPRPVRRSGRGDYVRLARVPNMLGDSLAMKSRFTGELIAVGPFISELPLGAGRSVKIGENNKGLPMDRVYFMYNGFKNALTSNFGGQTEKTNLDRYTLGGEKTFWDGMASLDVRMPFVGGFLAGDPDVASVQSENVGDVSMLLKGLLYTDDTLSLVAGVGMTLPTASDLRGQVNFPPPGSGFRLRNEAVHIFPYVGFAATSPSEDWFYQGFLQGDFAASGFRVQVDGLPAGPEYTEQDLMYVDFLLGRWLYVNDYAPYLRGIAALFELHYTTTLEDSDLVVIPMQGTTGRLENPFNRVDILNITGGLHFQIGELANLRVSCVAPLRTGGDRQFDAEVVVSFNRNF
jgi:hypothetical protein